MSSTVGMHSQDAAEKVTFFPGWRKRWGGWRRPGYCPLPPCLDIFDPLLWAQLMSSGKAACSAFPREFCGCFCLLSCSPLPSLPKFKCCLLAGASSCFLCVDPVSRKNVKSAHSTRNRYSSQWTLTKCQASTPARTLTSDWRTVGSQHGVTVTESDSYSASLSQDTGETWAKPVSCSLPSASPSSIFTFCFPNSYPPACGVHNTNQLHLQLATDLLCCCDESNGHY